MKMPNFDINQLLETLIGLPVGTIAVVRLFDSPTDDPQEPDEDDKDKIDPNDPYMGLFDDLQIDFGGGGSSNFLQMQSGSSSSSISGLPPA